MPVFGYSPIDRRRDSAARHEREDCGNASADRDPEGLLRLRPCRRHDEPDRFHGLIETRTRIAQGLLFGLSRARTRQPHLLAHGLGRERQCGTFGQPFERLARLFSVLIDLCEIVAVIPPRQVV